MMCGVGIDIVSLARMREFYLRHADQLANGLFTHQELSRCGVQCDGDGIIEDSGMSAGCIAALAGCFAAKEAAVKALGLTAGSFNWSDLEISDFERPEVILHGEAQNEASRKGVSRLVGECTYTADHAVAVIFGEARV